MGRGCWGEEGTGEEEKEKEKNGRSEMPWLPDELDINERRIIKAECQRKSYQMCK